MTLTEIIEGCVKSLRNRISSPFWFTYTIVWLAANYEIWMTLFYGSDSVANRINTIKSNYSNPWEVFGIPFLVTLLMIGIGPWISAIYTWYIIKPSKIASTQKTKHQVALASARADLTAIELKEKRDTQKYEMQMVEQKEEADFNRRQRQIQLEHDLQKTQLESLKRELESREKMLEDREKRLVNDTDRLRYEKSDYDQDLLERERRLQELDSQMTARNSTLSEVNQKISDANNDLQKLQSLIKEKDKEIEMNKSKITRRK